MYKQGIQENYVFAIFVQSIPTYCCQRSWKFSTQCECRSLLRLAIFWTTSADEGEVAKIQKDYWKKKLFLYSLYLEAGLLLGCDGEAEEVEECNVKGCPGWSPWSQVGTHSEAVLTNQSLNLHNIYI